MEGHWYARYLFDIFLTIYLKCYLFHFFTHGIRMQIPILAGVQNERKTAKKTVFFG